MADEVQAVREVLYELSIEGSCNLRPFVASVDGGDVVILAGSAPLDEVVSEAC